MSIVTIPWTPEQVESLNLFQKRRDIHPYTCGTKEKHNPGDDENLVATALGWRCPSCDYHQNWAHEMTIKMGVRMDIIQREDLVERGIYRLHSRNLYVGVWDGRREKSCGFIGIREKFGEISLFKEFHWDDGAPYGTAKPLELLGILPEGIDIREGYMPEDYKARYPEKYHGEYYYTNTELLDVLKPYDDIESEKAPKW